MTRASGSELLTDQLRMMADHFAAEPAYVEVGSGDQITFAEWDAESDRLAAGLLDSGVEKGDRVAVFMEPDDALRWVVAYAAAHKAGAVAVPTSSRLAPRELEHVLRHSGAVAVFAGAGTTETFGSLERGDLDVRVAVSSLIDRPDGFVGWDDWPGAGPVQIPLDPDDMADIMYTSGTTGRPKGVVVRHRTVAMVPNGLPNWSGDGWLHASPLWTFAGIACVYNPMKLGMTGLYQARFDGGEWLAQVERRRPTAVFLVPAMAQILIAHPNFDSADLDSLKMVTLGSAPLAPETFRRLRERLPGAWVSNNWGMTEAGPAYCMLPPEEAERRVGSVGKPLPPVTFRVVDDSGTELPPRGVGELLVSNPGREREYFNDEDATNSTWQDGWLHTGDVAYLDEDGYLYIVGRKKDVIIRGGNNIHSVDVESALMEHPDVQEAAVAGIAHPVLGEDVAAWVVPKPGVSLDPTELQAFLGPRLASYKIPRKWTFVEELPRNPTGKVLKHVLAESGA